MPRKTGTEVSTGPVVGTPEVIVINEAGDNISGNITSLGDTLDEQVVETKRIRQANELILGQEVDSL